MKKAKKFLTLIAASFFITACVVEDDSSDSSSSGTSLSDGTSISATASGSDFSAPNKIYIDLDNAKVSSDETTWSEITTTSIDFFDETVKVKYTEDDSGNSTGLIRVDAVDSTENLAIYLSGSQTSGGVKIQTSTSYEIGLYLDSVSITSTNYPCIDITKGGSATVFLSGTNTLIDGRKYGYGYGDSASSCASGRIGSAEGSDSKGTLYCKGGLTIVESDDGGSLSVTQAYKNCIASKDGILTIESGSLTLKNYTSSSETGKNGLFGGQGIVVNGGKISFDGKGIVSTSDLRKANGFKTDDEDYPSSYVKINGGTVNVTTYNGKGINAPVVAISGGTNTFTVTGTTSYSESTKSGSWYDADGVKETGTVKFAPEGIEGASSITISGGSTIVSAPDDGINVSNSGGSLSISGGFLYVKAQGDGLDSNGNITISGGVTVVSQTGNGNSPIDCGDNYKFTVTGTSATVFAMGGSGMFSESIPSSTTIPMIYSTSCSGSTSLGVNGIIALASPQSYGAAILVSPSLTSGSSYSFVKGGTLGGTVYNSDAGVYFPATVSGGTSVSCTATTQGGSGSSMGGFSGGSSGPGGR
ncbi:MAG: carbohydrate-binding domain-containing protein [Treponema sp.]|nr:carbohydrate-binding domain-containing protein [Treponema sp.]